MTTLIVHGTFATNENWYWNSWQEGGFCHSLAAAMQNVSGGDDIWRINGIDVSEIPELNPKRNIWVGRLGQISQHKGYFIWSGDYNAISRKGAANQLIAYLNLVRELTPEPLRIIAHSHGCNVVKQASASDKLRSDVFFERAVFLACPHFMGDLYRQKGAFDLRMERVGKQYFYRLNPDRFGRIANMYSTRDPVVGKLADKLATASGWNYEVPEVSFVDQDPAARHLYENYEMEVPGEVSGNGIHGWLHSAPMGYSVGLWLETGSF